MEEQLYGLLRQCTMRVATLSGNGYGTGFFVAPGLIITCHHVVEDMAPGGSPTQVFWNGQIYDAQLLQAVPAYDLALLTTELREHPCVLLHEGARPFDSIYSYGYTDEYPVGESSAFILEGWTGDLLKLKAAQVRPGQSGSPLLNLRTGGVCGVMQLTRDRSTDLGGRAIAATFIIRAFPEIAELQRQYHQENQQWSLLAERSSERYEIKRNIRSKFIDQSDYVQDHLERFVGREAELAVIRGHIAEKMERGGYVVVTGDMGQGKSSIIAKMIADQGIDISTYHLIQSGDDFNYQVSILRSLMARLILIHDLPEHYIAGESYEILRDYFPRVLRDIAEKGAQEVIYIDGLDQLRMDTTGSPELGFLPLRLPQGIVIVVGTRPNRALEDFQNRIGSVDVYPLPGLSRGDFQLLLQHHEISLAAELSSRLHEKLKSNPLYLDLVARALEKHQDLELEELITGLENNPNKVFSFTFSRMRRLGNWYDVVRPMMGVLLVVQEALSSQQIAHILGIESNRIREGRTILGGLLQQTGRGRFRLYHPKLNDYLRQVVHGPGDDIPFVAEEIETLHERMVDWCEQGPIERLWLKLSSPSARDDYQEYARKHYITHLNAAGRYDRLFQVLNEGSYERGKLAADPSTRSSAMDLMLGCQAAAREASTLEEGKRLLMNLWRYILLRTSLTTQADAYPIEAFQALLALGKENEALGLAELLTQPASKLAVLNLIARYHFQQPAREEEGEGMQQYTRAYELIPFLRNTAMRARALRELTTTLIDVGQLAQAEEVARLIPLKDEQISMISTLAAKWKLAGEEERAEKLWQEAVTMLATLTDSDEQGRAASALAHSLLQVKDWERAGIVARAIGNEQERVSALSQLALSMTQEGLKPRPIWKEAEGVIRAIRDRKSQERVYRVYALAQIEAGLEREAEGIMQNKISSPAEKVLVLKGLAISLMREGAWERIRGIMGQIASEYSRSDVDHPLLDNILVDLSTELAKKEQWKQAQEVAQTIPRKEALSRVLMRIVIEMAHAGMSGMAQTLWNEARAMSRAQTDDVQTEVASTLVGALVKVGQIERAREIIPTLPDKQAQERVMEEIACALTCNGDVEGAEQIASTITHPQRKATIQRHIAIVQIRAGQSELALTTVSSIVLKEIQLEALKDLVAIASQMRQWELAQGIANQFQYEHEQAEALRDIIIGLVQNGETKEAERIAGSIRNRYLRARAMCDLATALAPYQQYIDDANRIVRNIKTNNALRQMARCNIDMVGWLGASGGEDTALKISEGAEREEALCNVAIKYACEGLWGKAKELIGKISDKDRQDEAWASVAVEQVRAGLWEEAMVAFDEIKGEKRLTVVHEWGLLLAQAGDRERRGQIARHLGERSREKASFYMSMVMAKRGRLPEQVHLTQQAWLGASTKADCQYLFAMVQELLLSDPELCTAFYGSFEWVRMFLDG